MSIVYTLFEVDGTFRSFTFAVDLKNNSIGGSYVEIDRPEWDLNFNAARKIPVLAGGVVTWIDRPVKARP
jgi:hypothetical protein